MDGHSFMFDVYSLEGEKQTFNYVEQFDQSNQICFFVLF